jgi:hypothetical protein
MSFLNSKSMLLALAICSTLTAAHAEPTANTPFKSLPPFSLVPEIGNTYFHVTGMDSSYRSATVIGAKARLMTENDRLTLSAGAQYFQAGFKLRADLGFLSINVAEVATDYLAVPLGAEYMLSQPNHEGTQYFVNGHMTPAYLLSARYKNLLDSQEKEHGIRSSMNGYDVLVGGGFGARQHTQIGQFEFILDYQKGLRDVSKDMNGKNEGFVAKAGYTIVM